MSAVEQAQPSLADILSVVAKERGPDEAFRLERAARKLMFKRLIAANQNATERAIASLRDAASASARLDIQTQLDRLFTEREQLSNAAYGPMPAFEVGT